VPKARRVWASSSHYGYDGDDNRTTFTSAGGTVNPSYDVQDRLGTYGPASYAFTANGELVSKTVGSQLTTYTYDALGNLLNVTLPVALPDGAQTIDYIVDGQNRSVGRLVNGSLSQGWLYQDQLRPVAQLDGSGTNVVARFVYGSKANVPDYMVTSGGTYRILSDHLGSPRAVVDVSSGNLIETINFDEFGNETDTLAGTLPTGYVRIPFGFAGGLYDPDTGLVRFGARDYDASVGRWTSKDPTRFTGGRNLYGYVVNDPVNRVDPGGRLPDWLCAVLPFLCDGGGGGGGGGGGAAAGGPGGGGDGGADGGLVCGGIPQSPANDNGKKCYYTGYTDVGTSAGMRQVECAYDCPGVPEEVTRVTTVYSGQDPVDRCTDDNVAPDANPFRKWPPLPMMFPYVSGGGVPFVVVP
jgi:RHS repeat-associated protein